MDMIGMIFFHYFVYKDLTAPKLHDTSDRRHLGS